MTELNNRFNTISSIMLMIFFYCLLIVNTLTRTQFKELTYIGDISIHLTFFVMILFLIKSWISQVNYDVSLLGLYIALFLFASFISISYLTSKYMDDLLQIGQLILLILFIGGSARLSWSKKLITSAGYVFGIITIFIFYDWMQTDFNMFGFKTVFRNENYLAILLFSFLYFHIICLRLNKHFERIFFMIVSLLNIILIFATSSRSVLISLITLLIFWSILKFYRPLFDKLIYIIIIGNIFFIGFYVLLSQLKIGVVLNEWSRSLFNKNLFSGRSEIWIGVMKEVIHKPFFGYGVGVKASHVTDTHLTTHNMYLQLLLEFGIVGLVLFIFLLAMIWRILIKRLDHFVVRFSACFLLSILIYLSFEMTLFQNNYSIAFFQWLIMTIGINYRDDYLH